MRYIQYARLKGCAEWEREIIIEDEIAGIRIKNRQGYFIDAFGKARQFRTAAEGTAWLKIQNYRFWMEYLLQLINAGREQSGLDKVERISRKQMLEFREKAIEAGKFEIVRMCNLVENAEQKMK